MQRQPEKPTRTQKRRVEAWKPQACEAATSQVSKLEGGWGRVCIASPPHPLGPLQALYSWSVQDCYFKVFNAALELLRDAGLVWML